MISLNYRLQEDNFRSVFVLTNSIARMSRNLRLTFISGSSMFHKFVARLRLFAKFKLFAIRSLTTKTKQTNQKSRRINENVAKV